LTAFNVLAESQKILLLGKIQKIKQA